MPKFLSGLCLCLLIAGISSSTQAQSPQTEILQRVNELRGRYGLPAFHWHDQLAQAAQNQADWMAATEVYSHVQTNGSNPRSRVVATGYPVDWAGENIVGGTNLSPGQGVTWWINSAPHFNNLIHKQYTEAGVGFAVSGNGQNMYVMVFGSQSNTPILPSRVANNPEAVEVTPIILSTPNEDGSIIHVVQQGQTAWVIAARYEVSLDEILYLNSLSEAPLLQVGDEIIIKLGEGQTPPPTPTPSYSHFVQEGETLWVIAIREEVALADLLYFNNLDENSFLQPGQEIKLRLRPGESPPPTATPQLTHIVQAGDTLIGIAIRYSLSLDELLEFNNIAAEKLLGIGDELWVSSPALPPPAATPFPATFTPNPDLVLGKGDEGDTPTPLAELNEEVPAFTPIPTITSTPIPPPLQSSQTQQPGLAFAGIGLLLLIGIAFLIKGR